MGYHDDLEEVSDGDEQRSRCSDGYPGSYGAREAEQRSLCHQHTVGRPCSLQLKCCLEECVKSARIDRGCVDVSVVKMLMCNVWWYCSMYDYICMYVCKCVLFYSILFSESTNNL